MVTCRTCVWGIDLTKETRLRLSQENKEIVNTLERRRLNLDDFCYCEQLGFIESRIMRRDCEEYMGN
ncbi:hypothetical protein KQH65_06015 [archaeon]|nr:hypothetical protein [archaeon]